MSGDGIPERSRTISKKKFRRPVNISSESQRVILDIIPLPIPSVRRLGCKRIGNRAVRCSTMKVMPRDPRGMVSADASYTHPSETCHPRAGRVATETRLDGSENRRRRSTAA